MLEAMQVEVNEAEDRGDGHHHVDGVVADGDHGDVRGEGDILDVQTKVQPSRPQALWKAKRRRGVGQDNLVQSRLSFFIRKFPNLKLHEGVKSNLKVLAENAAEKIRKEIISTLSLPGVGGVGGVKCKTGG